MEAKHKSGTWNHEGKRLYANLAGKVMLSCLPDTFYGDEQKFMKTKRFGRYCSIMEQFILETAFQKNMTKTQKPEDYCLVNMIKESLFLYLDTFTENETGIYGQSKKKMLIEVNADNMMFCFMPSENSILQLSKTEEQKAQDPRMIPKHLSDGIRKLAETDIYPSIVRGAFEKSCYELAYYTISENALKEENWFIQIKETGCTLGKAMFILRKTFSEMLEGLCGAVIIQNMFTESVEGDFRRFREEAEKQTSELEQKILELTIDNLDMQAEKHHMHRKYRTLERTSAQNTEAVKETETLRQITEELRAEKQSLLASNMKLAMQVQKLEEANRSMTNYLEKMKALEEEESKEDFSETPIKEDIFYKRIVFIRDKQAEGYVMMQKLQERFPNAKFTNTIASDIHVNSTDVIVALTAYTCHSIYYTAAGIAKKHNIPFLEVQNANVDIITRKIQGILYPEG